MRRPSRYHQGTTRKVPRASVSWEGLLLPIPLTCMCYDCYDLSMPRLQYFEGSEPEFRHDCVGCSSQATMRSYQQDNGKVAKLGSIAVKLSLKKYGVL